MVRYLVLTQYREAGCLEQRRLGQHYLFWLVHFGCFVWVFERSFLRLALSLPFLLLLLYLTLLLFLPVLLAEFHIRVHKEVDRARRVLLLLQHIQHRRQI